MKWFATVYVLDDTISSVDIYLKVFPISGSAEARGPFEVPPRRG